MVVWRKGAAGSCLKHCASWNVREVWSRHWAWVIRAQPGAFLGNLRPTTNVFYGVRADTLNRRYGTRGCNSLNLRREAGAGGKPLLYIQGGGQTPSGAGDMHCPRILTMYCLITQKRKGTDLAVGGKKSLI